jgi:hypothetical protein
VATETAASQQRARKQADRELVRRLQEDKRRARRQRPQRLARIEEQIDALGAEFRSLPAGHPRRASIVVELRPLGAKRAQLRYSLESERSSEG